MRNLLPVLGKAWKPERSPLYRHLPLREVNTGQIMRLGILNDLKDPENHAYDFLRGIPEVQALLEQYR